MKNRTRRKYQGLTAVAILAIFTVGQAPQPGLLILFPQHKKLLVTTGVASITGRFDPTTVVSVQLLEQFHTQHNINIYAKNQKENFTGNVCGIFPDNVILERVLLKTSRAKGEEHAYEYPFQLENNVDRSKFLMSTAFREMLKRIDDDRVLSAEVTKEGWSIRHTPVSSKTYQQQFGETFSFSVSLVPGLSLFYVRAVAEDTTIAAIDTVKFFYKTDLQSANPPAEFVHQAFHMDTNERQCASCHAFTLSASGRAQPSIGEADCKPCHNALAHQRSVHGPVALWNCLICHDPDTSPKYQLYTPGIYDAPLCLTCHKDREQELNSKPVVHGPATTNDCRKCHDPHGSSNDNLILARVNDLCTSCHAGTAGHPIAGHPLEGKQNPLNPEKAFSCISCHNPHVSEYRHLLIGPVTPSIFAFCQKCHHK